ncbi:DNA-binding CsgD family transcriptional regulator [Nocardioides thalensis]|uniref:DNA-binding CsgD family transcriptional regulator n=1 Tax=Nocardioides thalensis TaxID=1914755 RepID=A0A853C513_9ACTN|nr:AAA family ATPase [Nocardioides thalensis]NYJ03190.1 DNA-binding CsgD family transcriptional regulator [Nocardioides thalensis]
MFGRDQELGILGELVARREGVAQAALLGPPGVGKTTLLAALKNQAEASGVAVLSVRGHEADSNVAFAGLADLLARLAPGLDALPVGQRDAVLAVHEHGALPEEDGSLLLRLATGNLLTGLAAEKPLLFLVDDFHWMDHASRSVLGFVLRRLDGAPVVTVASARGTEVPSGLERARVIDLGPLDDVSARALLGSRYPSLVGAALKTVLRESAGNPLSLVELGRVAAQDPRAIATTDDLPPVERLEAVFAAELHELPAATRDVLALVAAGADDVAVLAAAVKPPLDIADLAPAERTGLISATRDHLEFRHPVARRAAYRAVPVARRRQLHTILAQVLAGDPDRRAWQIAAAATSPDETVAVELAAYAVRARARGAFVEAARAYERAATFTEEDSARAHRLLMAASLAGTSGNFAWVEDLATKVGQHTTDPQMLVLAEHNRAAALARTGLHRAATEALAEVVRDAVIADPTVGWAALSVQAVLIYQANGDRDLLRKEIAHLQAAAMPERPALPPQLSEPTQLWAAAATDPFHRSPDQLVRLKEMTADPAGLSSEFGHVRAMLLGAACWLLDQSVVAAELLGESVRLMRRHDAQGETGNPLTALGSVYLDLGRFADAEDVARELDQVAALDNSRFLGQSADHLRARAAAIRGDTGQARDLARRTLADLDRDDHRSLFCHLQLTLGLCDRVDADHHGAFAHLKELFEPDGTPRHEHVSMMAIAEIAGAAAQVARIDEVRPVLAHARDTIAGSGATRFELLLHHAEALTADHVTDTERLFRLAVDDPDGATWSFEHARAALDYGQWLRRQRRLTDARPILAAAADTFDATGAVSWATQARNELRAAGVTAEPPQDGVLAQLTPQQQQIVRMAADGLTNREIGERLFLSPRTISSHLYQIFPKLGVAGRHQLRDLLEGDDHSGR